MRFKVGQRVYMEGARLWYLGVLVHITAKGAYGVRFDHGPMGLGPTTQYCSEWQLRTEEEYALRELCR